MQEQSFVICVMWPSTLVTLCNKFGHNSSMLVVSQPLESRLNGYLVARPNQVIRLVCHD